MNTNKLLHASYITLLTLSLSSTLVNADETLFMSDDDNGIASIGVDYGSLSHAEALTIILPDDNDAIANIGVDLETSAHVHTATSFLPDDINDDTFSVGAG